MSERIHPEERFVYYGDVCNRCGAETSDADIWQVLCPRCRQLAALEAEIGRAVIGLHLIDQMRDHYDNDLWDNTVSASTYKADAILANIFNSKEGPRLITQWRQLHAEDAEAEAATGRQEGE